VVADDVHGLIYFSNGEGLWVVQTKPRQMTSTSAPTSALRIVLLAFPPIPGRSEHPARHSLPPVPPEERISSLSHQMSRPPVPQRDFRE